MTEPQATPHGAETRFHTAILALCIAMIISVVGVFWIALLDREVPLALATLTGALVGAVGTSVGLRIHDSVNGRKSVISGTAPEMQSAPPEM